MTEQEWDESPDEFMAEEFGDELELDDEDREPDCESKLATCGGVIGEVARYIRRRYDSDVLKKHIVTYDGRDREARRIVDTDGVSSMLLYILEPMADLATECGRKVALSVVREALYHLGVSIDVITPVMGDAEKVAA